MKQFLTRLGWILVLLNLLVCTAFADSDQTKNAMARWDGLTVVQASPDCDLEELKAVCLASAAQENVLLLRLFPQEPSPRSWVRCPEHRPLSPALKRSLGERYRTETGRGLYCLQSCDLPRSKHNGSTALAYLQTLSAIQSACARRGTTLCLAAGERLLFCREDSAAFRQQAWALLHAQDLPQAEAETIAVPASLDPKELTILMYHDITASEDGTGTLTTARFEDQLRALCAAGYHTVSFPEIRAFVEDGTPLPNKPLAITFDDGYQSNYDLAVPLLEQYGMKATIFVIGVSIGKDTYKDTDTPIHPHFSQEVIRELTQEHPLIDVESHGYNVHEVKGLDPAPLRRGALQRAGETDSAYMDFLLDDCDRMRELLPDASGVFAYPYGANSPFSEVILRSAGFYATLTTRGHRNLLVPGEPDCLYLLGRYSVQATETGTELVARISN